MKDFLMWCLVIMFACGVFGMMHYACHGIDRMYEEASVHGKP